jgi:hypothetical protein
MALLLFLPRHLYHSQPLWQARLWLAQLWLAQLWLAPGSQEESLLEQMQELRQLVVLMLDRTGSTASSRRLQPNM